MKPAPPFDCHRCARRIGKDRTHYLLDTGRVICCRCLTKPAHARLYPDCPHAWHDPLDHLDAAGTRAGIAATLGLWP
jgi:hypothetical protein